MKDSKNYTLSSYERRGGKSGKMVIQKVIHWKFWSLDIPSRDLAIRTEPLNPEAWNDHDIDYWEGPIKATGSHGGVGYLEMTGY